MIGSTFLLALAPSGDSSKGDSDGSHGGYTDLGEWVGDVLAPLYRSGEDQLGISGVIVAFLLLAGAFFSLVSAIGIVRMPDLYTRMQAAAKSSTLGVTCLVLAVAFHFSASPVALTVAVETVLILVFIFLTTPASAHLIGRAAYFVDVPLWERTAHDELAGCYDTPNHDISKNQRLTPSASSPKDTVEPQRATG
ncbi:MAG: monovalent cation/H(+) antiporter subunit G [Planctomycetota bacterium]